MATPAPTFPESLLAEADWVRALARRLLADAAEADDAAQDALLAASGAAMPKPRARGRRYLAAVLQNAVRQSRRAAARRALREHARAISPFASSSDPVETSEQLERHRAVVDAVDALAEPYRSAIWLRYFDGLTPRGIAARLGVPVKTVDSRLHRGLAQLRERLRARFGADRWAAFLLPLAWGSPTPAAATTIGTGVGLGMGLKIKLGVAAAIAAFGASWFLLPTPAKESEAPAAQRAAYVSGGGGGSGGSGGGAKGGRSTRDPARAGRRAVGRGTAAAPRQPATRTLRARVLDATGAPVAGLRIAMSAPGGAATLTSDAAGWLQGEVPDVRGTLRPASDTDYLTVMEGVVVPRSDVPPVVVVAPAIELAGTVVDDHGAPVAAAEVSLELPDDFVARLDAPLDNAARERWRARASAAGTFSLGRVPAIPDATVEVMHRGFHTVRRDAPLTSDQALWITMQARPIGERLAGRVLLPNGAPATSARVAIGMHTVKTDARGAFELDLTRRWTGADRVTAVQAGYLPAIADRPEDTGEWPDHLELWLGGTPLTITGRVVRPDGQPVPNATVWITNPTLFGTVRGAPAQLESMTAGVAEPRRTMSDGSPPNGFTDLTIPQSKPNVLWAWVGTDAAGRFELGGLMDRTYTVAAMDGATLQVVEQPDLPAGSGSVDLVLPNDGLLPTVRGRLLSQGGAPLAGLEVVVMRRSFGQRVAADTGELDIGMMSRAGSTVSDADGRFELQRLPSDGVFLYVAGDSVLEHTHPITASDRDQEIELHLVATGDVRVETTIEADAVGLIDGAGERLDLMQRSAGGGVNVWLTLPLFDGRSEVFAAPEDAAAVLLLRGGAEIDRQPLHVVPGERIVVRG
ncbi:MAG: sigma-70 family RNA polymerase sigma factor [Planctomycetota bacterium]